MSRIVMITPDIFSIASKYQAIRKKMTEYYDISVVSLSQKTFQPYTNSKTSLIYLSFPKKNDFLNYCEDYKELDWQKVDYSILAKNNWVFRGGKQLDGETILKEVLEQVHPPKAQIEPNQKYYELTVRTNGRGVERRIKNKRDYIWGSEIQSDRYIASAGLLILSKIDARNGSIGIILESLGGSLITSTFLLFRVKNVNPHCLFFLLTTNYYQSYFESLSCGTTNRRSLNINDFLNTKISLKKSEQILSKIQKKSS